VTTTVIRLAARRVESARSLSGPRCGCPTTEWNVSARVRKLRFFPLFNYYHAFCLCVFDRLVCAVSLPSSAMLDSLCIDALCFILPFASLHSSNFSLSRRRSSSVPQDIHEFILKQTTTKVPGWNRLTQDDIHVEELCGGLTNKLYKASLRDTTKHPAIQFPQVVVRFFGQDTDVFFERETEQQIARSLSDSRKGVRVFSMFKEFGGGRIEAFYNGRTLNCDDLSDPDISRKIAGSMALLHSLDVPISRQPHLLLRLPAWLQTARSLHIPSIASQFSERVFAFEWIQKEAAWLIESLKQLNSPVVFSHNDLQEGNVLYDEATGDAHVIDYEYSSYNFRGFDLGNHFCEHFIDYRAKEYPNFKIDPAKYPSKEHQLEFLSSYLEVYSEELKRLESLGAIDDDSNPLPLVKSTTVEDLYKEAQYFMMASHLLWSVWAVIQSKKSDIKFGYLEYAHARLCAYVKQKEKVFQELPLTPAI